MIPTVDSDTRIEATLKEVKEKCLMFQKVGLISEFEIIPVGQISGDGTFAVLHKYDLDDVVRPQYLSRRGKGLACHFGVMKAKYSWILFLDDDLNYPITFLFDAIPLTQKYDIIIASRVGRKDMPITRRFASFAYRRFAHAMFDLKGIYDIQSGEKLLRKNIFSFEADDILFSPHKIFPQERGYVFDTEVLSLAKRKGYLIAEIPVVYVYQKSVLRLSRAWLDMGIELLKLRWRSWNAKD